MNNSPEKIIVSLTSWRKRIWSVKYLVMEMWHQTLKPDIVVLNLSSDEFPLREVELPKSLLKLRDKGLLEIFWVKENTKCFKKLIPTLKRYPLDIVITVDDDMHYPPPFIRQIYDVYMANGGKYPITGATIPLTDNLYWASGCRSLYKREFFGKYLDEFLDEDLISTYEDDRIYTYMLLLNGVKFVPMDIPLSPRRKVFCRGNLFYWQTLFAYWAHKYEMRKTGVYNSERTERVLQDKLMQRYGMSESDVWRRVTATAK